MVAEYNGNNGQLRRYVHSDQVDEPWVEYSGSNIGISYRTYLHADHQGSIIARTDGSGNYLTKLTYDSFGIPGASNTGRFGYTGQMWLNELGLFHYKARLYSPKLGRFLQTDPIFYADNMNMYAYVGNDPINMIDPSGMSREYYDEPDDFDPTTDDPTKLDCGCKGTSMSNSDGSDDDGSDEESNEPGSDDNLPVSEGNENPQEITDQLPPSPNPKVKDVPDTAKPNDVIEGRRRTREYDNEGKPRRDYDKPHQGDETDHVHEWKNGRREHPGRPYSPWPRS